MSKAVSREVSQDEIRLKKYQEPKKFIEFLKGKNEENFNFNGEVKKQPYINLNSGNLMKKDIRKDEFNTFLHNNSKYQVLIDKKKIISENLKKQDINKSSEGLFSMISNISNTKGHKKMNSLGILRLKH